MNKRIKELARQSGISILYEYDGYDGHAAVANLADIEKFAELIVESVLDQVKERAYYTGDRDWSDEVDRPWIQLEFGYGELHDAKCHKGKWIKK
jgi:hypothetical protein